MHVESRKCYLWTYLQGGNGDTDIENRLGQWEEKRMG